jgi:acylphosphatase
MQRRTVYYSGRVQGVGFRMTTQFIARGFEVAGYVKNLPDGRVEMVAEGKPAELDRFLDAIDEQMTGLVREKQVDTAAASGQFADFTIAH